MPVRWGLMSTAAINRRFVAGARQSANVEVVAIASRDLEAAKRHADELGIERAHGGYDALLADSDVEAVYVSLPNSLHMEWTVRALKAGKHVLCEKPLSRHAAEVEAAFDAAEHEGRLLMEGFMYRHAPQTRRLGELVAQGAVGRVRTIRIAFSVGARDPSDIRRSAALDGGALMDLGCYCVNIARMLAGEPERLFAQQTVGSDGVDVIFAAAMSFPDDVIAHFDVGFGLPIRNELEVVGNEGVLYLGDPWQFLAPIIELRRGDQTERIEFKLTNSYRLEADNMSAAILGAIPPLLGRADAVGQARALEALHGAAKTGHAVNLR